VLAGLRARSVEIEAIELAAPSRELVFVRGGARQELSFGAVERPLRVPAAWSSAVLLLSGLSPSVAHAGALCKVARAARRAGTTVVVDLNADWHLWKGHDSRTVRMILREADVVWASAADLFGINLDLPSLRAAVRETAVVVLSDAASRVTATGAFGEVTAPLDDADADADAHITSICAELARPTGSSGAALWSRLLTRSRR
jgi:sugar/nucleoside kinase (ribokinase family)